MYKKLLIPLLFLLSPSASAYKNCAETIASIYVGDRGWLWLTFENGGVAHIKNTETDFDNILSVALAAKMSGSEIVIRYWDAGNDATCSQTRGDIQGLRVN